MKSGASNIKQTTRKNKDVLSENSVFGIEQAKEELTIEKLRAYDGFEDVDEEEYENAVYELEDEGPGEINDNLIDFDERDLFFDVQNAARTYCRENNMDYTAENLERIIPELTIEYVEEVTNFETMVETITEDIKDRAHSDFENRLRYMVDAL